MTIITENIIDGLMDKYENEAAYLEDLKKMAEQQQDLVSFIDQENYTLLTFDEVALMEYLTVIIYSASQSVTNKKLFITGKQLEKCEEENWDIFNATNTKNFAKILDRFFENYPQEDLLALVEDSLQPEDDSIVTSVGREIIFVACKSIIDSIHLQNN
ncbi:MAG: hypothetical protein KA270_15645 [Saprospiraceae bacterium]|nr:hypothetical protein [Saprospiraceae bacterium]MBP6568604.1 hypothetical protein [Saprospiraceae bacterium]